MAPCGDWGLVSATEVFVSGSLLPDAADSDGVDGVEGSLVLSFSDGLVDVVGDGVAEVVGVWTLPSAAGRWGDERPVVLG